MILRHVSLQNQAKLSKNEVLHEKNMLNIAILEERVKNSGGTWKCEKKQLHTKVHTAIQPQPEKSSITVSRLTLLLQTLSPSQSPIGNEVCHVINIFRQKNKLSNSFPN
jgi:hypothetical protein